MRRLFEIARWTLTAVLTLAVLAGAFVFLARTIPDAAAAPAPPACAKPVAFYVSADSAYYELRCSRHAVPHIVVVPDSTDATP